MPDVYLKAAPAGLLVQVYTENNLDEIIAFASGAGTVEVVKGVLYVFGERINRYDGVATSDDMVPTAKQKRWLATIKDEAYRVVGIVYDTTNIDEIAEFMGLDKITYNADGFFVQNTLIESGDLVGKNCGEFLKVSAANLASLYTLDPTGAIGGFELGIAPGVI